MKEKNELRKITDPRGFSYIISLEGFNKLIAKTDTSVSDYVLDVHIKALESYMNLVRDRFLSSPKELERTVRELFSIGWLKWNLVKMYRRIQLLFRKCYKWISGKKDFGR